MDSFLFAVAVNGLPLMFAITIHEAAHGYAADRFNDPTARMLGRITLNPIAHVHPIGTVILPLLMLWSGTGLVFGWAKPVPVNFANLRRPRRDSVLVAFAGPASNIAQFFVWAGLVLAIRLTVGLPDGLEMADMTSQVTAPLFLIGLAGMRWNFWLAVFNLMPILPLDGGRIVSGLLPFRMAETYAKLEPFGFFVVIAMLVFLGEYLAVLATPHQWVLRLLLE